MSRTRPVSVALVMTALTLAVATTAGCSHYASRTTVTLTNDTDADRIVLLCPHGECDPGYSVFVVAHDKSKLSVKTTVADGGPDSLQILGNDGDHPQCIFTLKDGSQYKVSEAEIC
ncbi:hypothetical protein ACPPVT_02225 [Angustibacter sp. McL0619]|uniref:hypothetical protein n=1 Tax=Angustibacter sp. McL0619 TaxID=3415676 RepID=UPI003CF73843